MPPFKMVMKKYLENLTKALKEVLKNKTSYIVAIVSFFIIFIIGALLPSHEFIGFTWSSDLFTFAEKVKLKMHVLMCSACARYEKQSLMLEKHIETLTKAYKKAIFKHHPDHGGTSEAFIELQNAYEYLMGEIQYPSKKYSSDTKQVEDIMDLEKLCLAYTINDPQKAQELQRWGVDGFFSDTPDLIKESIFSVH